MSRSSISFLKLLMQFVTSIGSMEFICPNAAAACGVPEPAIASGICHWPSVSTSNFVSSEMIPSTPILAARSICRGSLTVQVTTVFPAA